MSDKNIRTRIAKPSQKLLLHTANLQKQDGHGLYALEVSRAHGSIVLASVSGCHCCSDEPQVKPFVEKLFLNVEILKQREVGKLKVSLLACTSDLKAVCKGANEQKNWRAGIADDASLTVLWKEAQRCLTQPAFANKIDTLFQKLEQDCC